MPYPRQNNCLILLTFRHSPLITMPDRHLLPTQRSLLILPSGSPESGHREKVKTQFSDEVYPILFERKRLEPLLFVNSFNLYNS